LFSIVQYCSQFSVLRRKYALGRLSSKLTKRSGLYAIDCRKLAKLAYLKADLYVTAIWFLPNSGTVDHKKNQINVVNLL